MLHNYRAAAGTHNGKTLAEHELDDAGVLICEIGNLRGPRAGYHGREVYHAALGLADYFLPQDKEVVILKLDGLSSQSRVDDLS
jgi:hypothetical protein